MTTSVASGEGAIAADTLERLVRELSRRISYSELTKEVNELDLHQLKEKVEIPQEEAWKVIRVATFLHKNRLINASQKNDR